MPRDHVEPKSVGPLGLLAAFVLSVPGCATISDLVVGPEEKLQPAPDAVVSDPELEQKMVEAMRADAKKRKLDKEVRVARISTKDWTMVRHSQTGVLTARKRQAYIGVMWSDGVCQFQEWAFYQRMGPSDFTGPLELGPPVESRKRPVDCSELTVQPPVYEDEVEAPKQVE